jgi:hypothetical protein
VTNTYSNEPRPVRKIPTREQIAYAAQRQAQREASRYQAGHYAGLHPEDTPFQSGALQQSVIVADDYELEEEEEYYVTNPHTRHTSTRRYQQMPDITTRQGRVNIVEHYHQQPLRASRQQLPPPRQPKSDFEEEEPIHGIPRRRRHPLLWLGIFALFLISGWIGLNFVTTWYQGVQDDLTYGKQRHFEINAVVGHGDSPANPSHFTAENNNGQIIVIELPGGNVSKAKIYQIETIPGNTGNPPVKLSFTDMNGDGKLDMIVQIGDGSAMIYLTLLNNGSEFVSKL